MNADRHLDDEVLSALLDGDLTDREALAHQAACETCRARADAFRRVSSLVAWPIPAPGAGFDPGRLRDEEGQDDEDDGELDRAVAAALAEIGSGVRRARRRVLRGVASVAACLAGAAIILSLFGHQPPPTGTSRGLTASLGTFSNGRELSATLETEIASLAPSGSAPVLPCQAKAAAGAGQPPATTPVFSAPLVYAGVKAEVFAYEAVIEQGKGVVAGGSPRGGPGTASAQAGIPGSQSLASGFSPSERIAIVVRDGDCTQVTHLLW